MWQPDGKILVGGQAIAAAHDSVLVRLNADGTFDSSFASNGAFVGDLAGIAGVAGGNDAIESIALQSNGAIVVAGYADRAASTQSAMVARFTSSGALDTSFNGTGVSIDTLSSLTMDAPSVVLDATNRPVLCGGTLEAVQRGFVSRRATAGALDASFDGDGWALLDGSGTALGSADPTSGRL